MLSPTTLSGLSIGLADWFRPVREVSPAQAPTQGNPQPVVPLVPLPFPGTGAQTDGGAPARTLPRGSLLDLSV